jgi:uncharacterized protein YeaO (DUF488 family)
MNIETARIYENKKASDNIRILVDRLWPRGISKENAHLDHWCKDWAPSDDLRKDFHQEKISWEEFSENYKKELIDNKEQILNDLSNLDKRKSLVLLYGSKNKTQNHAVLLKSFLEKL